MRARGNIFSERLGYISCETRMRRKECCLLYCIRTTTASEQIQSRSKSALNDDDATVTEVIDNISSLQSKRLWCSD